MSERLELLQIYNQAMVAYDRAKSFLDNIKDQLKELGTFTEENYKVDVSVITRETISVTKLKQKNPALFVKLQELGFVNSSESERLTVKLVKEVDQ